MAPTPACPVTKLGPGQPPLATGQAASPAHRAGQPANGQGKKAASKPGQPASQATCPQTGPLGRPRIRGTGNHPWTIHVQSMSKPWTIPMSNCHTKHWPVAGVTFKRNPLVSLPPLSGFHVQLLCCLAGQLDMGIGYGLDMARTLASGDALA